MTSQLCILLLQSLCWDSPSSWACWRYVPAPAPTAAWSVGAANKTRLNRVASRTRTRLPRRWRVQSIRCACFAVHTSIRRCCVIVASLCAHSAHGCAPTRTGYATHNAHVDHTWCPFSAPAQHACCRFLSCVAASNLLALLICKCFLSGCVLWAWCNTAHCTELFEQERPVPACWATCLQQ